MKLRRTCWWLAVVLLVSSCHSLTCKEAISPDEAIASSLVLSDFADSIQSVPLKSPFPVSGIQKQNGELLFWQRNH